MKQFDFISQILGNNKTVEPKSFPTYTLSEKTQKEVEKVIKETSNKIVENAIKKFNFDEFTVYDRAFKM